MSLTKEETQTRLKATHTRELKQMLDSARACGGWYSPSGDSSGWGYTFADLKAEMDTREHLPNKKEGKELRRAASRKGR